MKKLFVIMLFVIVNVLSAQGTSETECFSEFNLGLYGGINLGDSETGNVYLAEIKTNLGRSIKLRVSLGYSKIYQPISKTVRTYGEINFDDVHAYQAILYEIEKRDYDLFPVAIGVQYLYKNQAEFEPYVIAEVHFNKITSTKNVNSPGEIWTYDSFEEIPQEFRTKYDEKFPTDSFGVAVGVGTSYKITSALNLDLRYFFKIDSELINTHNFIVGVNF